jgi:FkbM family methyltransferase
MLINFRRYVANKFPKLYKLLLPFGILYVDKLWQLYNIFRKNKPIEVKVGVDSIFLLPEGHIAEMIWKHSFEQKERKFVEKYLKPGMCVLNIGANIGLYTLIAANIVGSRGVVHAFEPSRLNFDRLKRNVQLNGFTNVIYNQMAVSNFNGSLALHSDPAYPKLDSHYQTQRVIDGRHPEGFIEFVNCVTLDNYWMKICRGVPTKVDIIIMDIEGAELDALKGSNNIFELSPNLIMMIECTKNLDEIEALLRKKNFKFLKLNSATMQEEIPIQQGNNFVFCQNIK